MAGGSIRLFGGKADFLRIKPEFIVELESMLVSGSDSICFCEYNGDVTDGCMAQDLGDKVEEVIKNGGKYASKENFKLYLKQGITNQRCTYCYAKRHNGGRTTPKKVDKNDFPSFRKLINTPPCVFVTIEL